MKFITKKADRIIEMLFGKLTPTGTIWARTGLGFAVIAALMSFGFGKEMHWIHGVGLAFLTIVTALTPDAAHNQYDKKNFGAAIAIALFAIPMFVMEFASHSGYAAGFRGKEITEAKVQNTRFDAAHDAAKDDAANLAIWRKQLASLQEQNAWAGSVKAEALRGELKNLDDKIAYEIKGGRDGRAAGCKKVCEQLKDDRAKLEAKIGTIEQASDLTKRIEATQRILDGKRTVAGNTEHKTSIMGHQNGFFAKTVALVTNQDLKVSDVMTEGAEHGLAIGLAYVFTGGPALALFVAGLYRIRTKEEDESVGDIVRKTADAIANTSVASLNDARAKMASAIPNSSLSAKYEGDFLASLKGLKTA